MPSVLQSLVFFQLYHLLNTNQMLVTSYLSIPDNTHLHAQGHIFDQDYLQQFLNVLYLLLHYQFLQRGTPAQ